MEVTSSQYPAIPELRPIACAGDPLSTIDTPALMIDLEAFERNIDRLQHAADAAKVVLRPHAKAHKCPAIALAQIRRGAVGICCQKVSEALPFVQAGVEDIHISNQIVGPTKATLLAQLARHARMSVCIDHSTQIADLAAATRDANSELGILIEINIGQDRCGVENAEAVLRLLDTLTAHPRLHFKGLQAYHGKVQHVRDYNERRDMAGCSASRAEAVVSDLDRAGVSCEVVTGGGSGSAEFDLASGVYTELQAGSYVFMDGDYSRNDYGPSLRFEQSLFLISRVMSLGDGHRTILDAGLKSVAVDSGLPDMVVEGLEYVAANDEHGIVRTRSAETPRPALGELVKLIPGHCDPTLNLHDELVAVRQGRVKAVWPVAARGLSR
jgi:D-serine deaminase-like pyridoxal phosphate-dependent protein